MTTVIREDLDNLYNWTRIEETFDNDVLIGKVTFFDNGLITAIDYDAGVRRYMVEEDNPQGTGNVKSWDRIETYYDTQGVLEARVTTYDNGIMREQQFQDGVRSYTAQYDNPQSGGPGARKAGTRSRAYYDPAGVIEAQG